MDPLSTTANQRAFGRAAGRLCDTVTRIVGFVFVIVGVFALYSTHTAGIMGSAYTLELFAVSIRFTESGPLGGVAVYHQVLGFGFIVVAIGAAIVLGSTRKRN